MDKNIKPKIDPFTPKKPLGSIPGGNQSLTPLFEKINRLEHTVNQLVIWVKEIAKALNLDLKGLANFPLEPSQ